MKIAFNTVTIGGHTGYGNASRLLTEALSNLGVEFDDDADIVLNFCMPKDYIYGEYTIGYTPWESTEVPANWRRGLTHVDDLWTTSTWTASVFKHLTQRAAWVLPHGVESCWKPSHHETHYPFRFLHVGEPAVRKGGDIVLQAWHKRFANDTGVGLIYKCTGWPMARVKDNSGSIIASPSHFQNVQVINSIYSQEQMLDLYSVANCLVYPTRGEGFGLIPLEAMASGLPTILPADGGTADFSNFGIQLTNLMWKSSDQEEHPGLWMDHDVDEVIAAMEYIRTNYNEVADGAMYEAYNIHRQYDWSVIAQSALDRIWQKTGQS